MPHIVVHPSEDHRQYRARTDSNTSSPRRPAEVGEAWPHACDVRGVHEDRRLPEVNPVRLRPAPGRTGVKQGYHRAVPMPGFRSGSNTASEMRSARPAAREKRSSTTSSAVLATPRGAGGDVDRARVHRRVKGRFVRGSRTMASKASLLAPRRCARGPPRDRTIEREAVGERLGNRLDGDSAARSPWDESLPSTVATRSGLLARRRELGCRSDLSVHSGKAFGVHGGEHDVHRLS